MNALILVTVVAHAYVWDGGPGSSITYHMVTSDFTTAQENAIEAAFDAWDAGAGEILRGATMSITRGSDDGGGALCNSKNEVFMKDGVFFDDHGWGDDVAHYNECFGSHDIVFNSDKTWCVGLPSTCASSSRSIGQAALHEMGHWIGFDHDDTRLATMNGAYPSGGDLGESEWRIHEDDYVGLVANRPDSSEGTNLLVAKFILDANGGSHEELNDGTWRFDRSDDVWADIVPSDIQAEIQSTSGSASPLIEWRLSSNNVCSSADYLIGTREPTISSNTSYLVGPTSWTLADSVPVGLYYLCVMMDANFEYGETSESDNILVSESKVQVLQ